MIVKPMIRNNICMNAHPVGAERNVERQISYVKERGPVAGAKRVLVIGASNGYGLASRIVSAFGAGAATIGVAFESPAKGSRTASVGWYNDQAFQRFAEKEGLQHRSFIADAFAHQTKTDVIDAIRDMMGQVDLVIYSLASGVRPDPDTGEMYRSALKPIGDVYESVTLDGKTGELKPVSLEPASEEEIANTVKVMGGEDWVLWIDALSEAGVLAPDATTLAYSYIGPDVTFPLYRDGTIGRAKEHLEATAHTIDARLSKTGGHAWVSINKALVTRASAVIPGVSPYVAVLYKVMKEKGLHEGTIEQIYRLYADQLARNGGPELDSDGRIRIDDWEMQDDVQADISAAWPRLSPENIRELADVEGFYQDFLNLHGFGFDGVDYEADVEV